MSAEKNIEIFRGYESDWAQWRIRAIKHANFYRGRQYSRRDSKNLQKMGLKPLSVNIVRPLLEQQNSILTSSRPTWKVVPQQGAAKEVAEIAQRYLVGKWNADYVDIQLDQVLLDMRKVGLGYLFVDVANFLDNSTFDITIERLNWKWVFPDPNFAKFDGSDAEHFLIHKKIGMNYAQVKFGLSERQLRDAMGDIIGANAYSTLVEVIDRFSKYPVERVGYSVKDEEKNYTSVGESIPTVFYVSRLKEKIEGEKRKWLKDLQELDNQGKIDLTKMRELNIYRCISVGNHTNYEGVMNIRDYPIVPFVNDMSDEANKTDSEVNFVEGIQEYINKFYMLTIHNAMLTGNVRFMAPEGAIKNKTQFQKTHSIPGSVSEWSIQSDLPDGGKPEIIQPGQLSSAFYGLASDLQSKAEYQLSMFAPVRGDAKGSPETFSTAASLQDFGTQRLKRIARRIDIMLAKAGEVALQFIQNYTDQNELLEYIDDRPFLESGQVNEAFGTTVESGTLNEFDIQQGAVRQLKNNSRIGKFAVKVLTQPNLGTDRLIKAGFLSNMVMNKAMPLTPSVARRIFDYLEVPGYMDIVKEISAGQPNADAIKKLMQQLQVMQKQNQMLQKQSFEMAKKLEISDFRFHLEAELQKIKEGVEGTKGEIVDEVMKILTENSNGKES